MQAQRMREIMDQKAGLVFDNIADDYGDADLAELIGEGKRKRRAQSGKAPKKTSKKSGNEWNVFLKKALKRHGKTMQDYMGNKALRTKISAEYKRSKVRGGAYDDDEEDSYDDDVEGGAMIGGAKTKKYKAKKKAYRKESTNSQYGVQLCTSNLWYLDLAGKIVKSKCNKVSNVDPTKPYSVKIKNSFKYEDENGDYLTIPQNAEQYKAADSIKESVKEARKEGKLPILANTKKINKGDEIFIKFMEDEGSKDEKKQSPLYKGAIRAIERGDKQRLNEIKNQVVKMVMYSSVPLSTSANIPKWISDDEKQVRRLFEQPGSNDAIFKLLTQ